MAACCPPRNAGSIEVRMGPSGDFVRVAERLPLPLTVHLGAGSDKFIGNGERDICYSRRLRGATAASAAPTTTSASPATGTATASAAPATTTASHGAGSDGCWGGPGNDVCIMGPGQDGCHGEGGNDRLFGGPSPDQLYGGDGVRLLQRHARLGESQPARPARCAEG